jgi:hypothetical protein
VLPWHVSDDEIVLRIAISFDGYALSCDRFDKEQRVIAECNQAYGKNWSTRARRIGFSFEGKEFACTGVPRTA